MSSRRRDAGGGAPIGDGLTATGGWPPIARLRNSLTPLRQLPLPRAAPKQARRHQCLRRPREGALHLRHRGNLRDRRQARARNQIRGVHPLPHTQGLGKLGSAALLPQRGLPYLAAGEGFRNAQYSVDTPFSGSYEGRDY